MEVAYCKIMFNMFSNKVLILFNIYILFHLWYYSCFSCGKKCFLSGDYDKIVSNIKKLMQDPCSRSVFVFSLCFCFGFVFVFQFLLVCRPLTAFAILSYGKRDFAEAEGRKIDRGKMNASPKGRWEGQKI